MNERKYGAFIIAGEFKGYKDVKIHLLRVEWNKFKEEQEIDWPEVVKERRDPKCPNLVESLGMPFPSGLGHLDNCFEGVQKRLRSVQRF